MAYQVTQIIDGYTHIDDDYKRAELKKNYTFATWEDVQNFLGLSVEGCEAGIKVEIKGVLNEA